MLNAFEISLPDWINFKIAQKIQFWIFSIVSHVIFKNGFLWNLHKLILIVL